MGIRGFFVLFIFRRVGIFIFFFSVGYLDVVSRRCELSFMNLYVV